MGEDKTADRDAILRAMSLAKSKAGDLNSSNDWLDEVNHTDYAASIQLTNAEKILKQAAEQAKAGGAKAYDKIKETLSADEAKAAMQSLLARGYQLRYYDADGRMLAVYADATAWADVNEEENGMITAEALTAADPSAEDISAVSLSKLYVYYGGHENRSREGEGLWFILNPAKTDLTAETYTWENDKPKGDFKKKAGDLNSSDSWLDAVNHADYAESVQLTNAENVLKQAAELAQADGAKAYDKVKALLTTEEAKTAMQNLLARGYQLRYYDANGKMLAVYANETAWADVSEAENGAVTAEALTAAAPTAEEIGAVSLSKLYVYYGSHEARSREGEGVWFILNPGKKDLTAETYTWKNDKPEGDFKQKEEPKATAPAAPATQSVAGQSYEWTSTTEDGMFTATCKQGGTTVTVRVTVTQNGTPFLALLGMAASKSVGDWANHNWTSLVMTMNSSQPISRVETSQSQMNIYFPTGTTSKGGKFVFTASDGTVREIAVAGQSSTPIYKAKPFGKGRLCRLGYSSARQNAAVKDAQRGEAGSLTAAGCCATHGEYGGIWNMKNQKKQNMDVLPSRPKRLPVPDHADMLTEDGTIYHVQSFFVGNVEMCDLLDALTIEAIERVK